MNCSIYKLYTDFSFLYTFCMNVHRYGIQTVCFFSGGSGRRWVYKLPGRRCRTCSTQNHTPRRARVLPNVCSDATGRSANCTTFAVIVSAGSTFASSRCQSRVSQSPPTNFLACTETFFWLATFSRSESISVA